MRKGIFGSTLFIITAAVIGSCSEYGTTAIDTTMPKRPAAALMEDAKKQLEDNPVPSLLKAYSEPETNAAEGKEALPEESDGSRENGADGEEETGKEVVPEPLVGMQPAIDTN